MIQRMEKDNPNKSFRSILRYDILNIKAEIYRSSLFMIPVSFATFCGEKRSYNIKM